MATQGTKPRPLRKWRVGGVSLAIWPADDNGYMSATVEARYYDKTTGGWKTTTQWSAANLMILSHLANLAAGTMLTHAPVEEDV